MRTFILSISALALAACDSGNVPSPTDRMNDPAAGAESVAIEGVELRGDGLVAGAEAFYFSAGQNEVVGSLSALLGEPVDNAANEECGAGPMQFASFAGGLTVNFKDGLLVGWNLGRADDAEAQQIAVVGDVQIGSDRAAATSADGYKPFAESTLGDEFSLGPRLGGFIEEDAVSMMYAGTQCFFR